MEKVPLKVYQETREERQTVCWIASEAGKVRHADIYGLSTRADPALALPGVFGDDQRKTIRSPYRPSLREPMPIVDLLRTASRRPLLRPNDMPSTHRRSALWQYLGKREPLHVGFDKGRFNACSRMGVCATGTLPVLLLAKEDADSSRYRSALTRKIPAEEHPVNQTSAPSSSKLVALEPERPLCPETTTKSRIQARLAKRQRRGF